MAGSRREEAKPETEIVEALGGKFSIFSYIALNIKHKNDDLYHLNALTKNISPRDITCRLMFCLYHIYLYFFNSNCFR